MGRQIADARQRDVIEVRRSLEVEAARLAARRRTTADVAAITTLRDERAEAYRSGQLDRMVAADLALHRAIARAARNPVLLSLYENLIDAVTDNIRFNFAHLQDGDNHDGLVDAIAAGDDARAVEETATYLSGLLGED
jgi:DNA-binding FadR family transcriptional regulator